MADVSYVGRWDDTRGQLILVGGIVVAMALVALVLLLNATMFAENIATRGLDPGADRAYDHAAFVEDAGAEIVTSENAPVANHDSWPSVENSISSGVTLVASASERYSFRRFGAYRSVSISSTRQGTVLIQNESREFTNASSPSVPDWTLAQTRGIRNASMSVAASQTANPSSLTDAFTLRIEGSGDGVWEAYVNSTSDDKVMVSTSTNDHCTSSASKATINWTEGTLAGCSFSFAEDSTDDNLSAPYTVKFQNGDKSAGTYRLVVSNHESDESVSTSNFTDPSVSPPGSPWWYPAVYSLEMTVTYDEEKTNYETGVRVAPDEPLQTRPA